MGHFCSQSLLSNLGEALRWRNVVAKPGCSECSTEQRLLNPSQCPAPAGFTPVCFSSALSSSHFLTCRLHNYSAANQFCFHFSLHNLLVLFKQENKVVVLFFNNFPWNIKPENSREQLVKNEKVWWPCIKGKQDLLTLSLHVCDSQTALWEEERFRNHSSPDIKPN